MATAAQLADEIREDNASTFESLPEDEWPRLVKLRDEDGRSLLHTAAANGRMAILEAFLQHGGDAVVNKQDEDGWTPLMSAASSGHEGAMQRLIACGAEVGPQNSTKRTALHYAASKGHLRAVKALLEAGARADVKDDVGALPLHRACSALQQHVVEALLAHAPRTVNAANRAGDTPLHVIVSVGQDPRSVEIARVLVRGGADLEAKNKEGETPLALLGGTLPSSIASALHADGDDAMDA